MTRPLSEADVPTLIDAWVSANSDFVALLRELKHDDWAARTECPGWSVADIVAHVISIESVMVGDPLPDHSPDWSVLPHITNDFGRLTEVGVDVLRGRAPQELLAEFDDVIARRAAQLRSGPQQLGVEIAGPFGPAPIDRVLRMRTFDTWVHEQDIRRAVGRPGNEGTAGAAVTAAQLLQAFPFLWGKKAAAPQESLLRVEIAGPGIEGSWRIVIGDDGRAVLTDSMDAPDVQLMTSWPDLVAVMCGRIEADEAETLAVIALAGFEDVARALVTSLAVTP